MGISRPLRMLGRLVKVAVLAALVYLVVTFVQVWQTAHQDQARPAGAIVVLGAAQYNGAPSPDLAARLTHALALWKEGMASRIIVTGGKQKGDRHTEAGASALWLEARGVPSANIVEVGGSDTWQSMSGVATAVGANATLGATVAASSTTGSSVVLVSDPFHEKRASMMASALGLTPYVSPTRSSPIRGAALVPYYAKETAEVALARVVGFPALVGPGGWAKKLTGSL